MASSAGCHAGLIYYYNACGPKYQVIYNQLQTLRSSMEGEHRGRIFLFSEARTWGFYGKYDNMHEDVKVVMKE